MYEHKGFSLPTDYRLLSPRERKVIREEYISRQEGLCFYCKGPLSQEPPESVTSIAIDWKLFPPGFLDYPIHLQHSHNTGLTEGAVHAYCNAVMWQVEGR